jgi:thioesterase domain-containing protein/3-oxoacyl-(acyl-carrier-protein) synthase/acyl carrier protein/SAM-dependent methyltransferase
MKNLLTNLMWWHLQALGAFAQPGRRSAEARAAAGILATHEAWFRECVRVFEQAGYVRLDDGQIFVAAPPALRFEDLMQQWRDEKQRWMATKDLSFGHALLEATVLALPDVLTGKKTATEVMFPGSSVTLVENAYKNSPMSDFFNRVLASMLADHVRQRHAEAPGVELRIVEIGAGTGATSAVVFETFQRLGLSVAEYCYTDISRAFLNHAETTYGPKNPFLTTRIINIDVPVAEQGLELGRYDVVIAANVLHTTRNIRKTLRNTKALLKRDGLLLLNELTTNNTLYNHLTFGLLEGWWLYEDGELRIPGSPALSVDNWRAVLEGEGYGSVTLPCLDAEDLGQQIIAAQSDGEIRLPPPKEVKSAATAQAPAASAVTSSTSGGAAASAADPVSRAIIDELAQSLRIDRNRVRLDESFSTYGLDSILAVQLTQSINDQLGIELEITVMFEHNTVEALRGHIAAEFPQQVEKLLAAAPPPAASPTPAAPAPMAEAATNAAPTAAPPAASPAAAPPAAPAAAPAQPSRGYAIVGMSVRLPQTEDLDQLWRVVESGQSCLTPPPLSRPDWRRFADDDERARLSAKRGGFLTGVEHFDPWFFGISMAEAKQMTPEQRLMLLHAWNALEDAGYATRDVASLPTGVFIAAAPTEYQAEFHARTFSAPAEASLLSSPALSMIPNRISYHFNLHGPSEYCETACSSALVALHRALGAMERGECSQAIVGGVQLIASPNGYAGMEAVGMLSPEGDVRPFQDGANGTVRSEGVGAIFLKPLDRAVADGDFVYAVVRSSAVNHAGKGVSFTAPNIRGMKLAIADAYHQAGVDPSSVAYVEAHGMSSALADGAELSALTSALTALSKEGEPEAPTSDTTYVGTIKPCFGHTEVFSGLAALMKTVLAMRHHIIPAIPSFRRLHSNLSLHNSRLQLATENLPWPALRDRQGQPLPRRASLNSFGIGGVNAHVILEEYVAPAEPVAPPSRQVVVLSARSSARLRARAAQLLAWCERSAGSSSGPDLRQIAWTLQRGREEMDDRLALVASDVAELIAKLRSTLASWPDAEGAAPALPAALREHVAFATAAQRNQELIELCASPAGEALLRGLLADGKLDMLATYWVKGASIDWSVVHGGARVGRVPLPGYPFEAVECWYTPPSPPAPQPSASGRAARAEAFASSVASLDGPSYARSSPAGFAAANGGAPAASLSYPRAVGTAASRLDTIAPGSDAIVGLDRFVTSLTASVLGTDAALLDRSRPLEQYGLNSLFLVGMLNHIRSAFPAFQPSWLSPTDTLDDIVARLHSIAPNGSSWGSAVPTQRYAELLHLNNETVGQPVFWIHGALGSVESFQGVARRSARPFYAIQARGFMTKDAPIEGITAMASYYLEIVRSVQPEGPYDLGGFCMGGIVAYEMTRLLQLQGQQVRTLVMVDSPDNTAFQRASTGKNISSKNAALQVANTLLWPSTEKQLDRVVQRLIHQRELDDDLSEDAFVDALARLAVQRGSKMPEHAVAEFVRRNLNVQVSYQLAAYRILPLPAPETVECYYFRNAGGLFHGELRTYFTITGETFSLDHVNYWQDWQRELPTLRMIDIPASNHMTLLYEDRAVDRIIDVCEPLYAR